VDGVEGSVLRASDRDAWVADAYERHVGTMVALATMLTGDASAAQDIAHDCFVSVMARLGTLHLDAPLDAYLRRSVVNAGRSRRRRGRIERRFLALQPRGEPVTSPPGEPFDDDPAWRAVMSLPFRQRAAVILRYAEDLSEEQVGQCAPHLAPGRQRPRLSRDGHAASDPR